MPVLAPRRPNSHNRLATIAKLAGPTSIHDRLLDRRKLDRGSWPAASKDEPRQVGVPGEVADIPLDEIPVDVTVSPALSVAP